MNNFGNIFLALCLALSPLYSEPEEGDYYRITPFEMPERENIEVGGIALMPDGKVAVSTRRGRVWTVDNAFSYPEETAEWKVYAEYLHESLGLAYKDGWLYAVQRPEVTRLKDEDGDGRADIFNTYSDAWGISGNYHEYNFMSGFDGEGNLYVVLCLTGSSQSAALYRGWVLQVKPDGTTVPYACGVRSPGGIGFNAEGDLFYTDNQGLWNGTSSLKWVKQGSFQGNPNGNVWFPFTEGAIGDEPVYPNVGDESYRIETAREEIETLVPPAVYFPHKKISQSPTAIVPDLSDGKFGPFAGQTFVAEQTQSTVLRVCLEKVNGVYQGAVFPFLKGFESGNIGLMLTEDGVMFTGGSNRGWGAVGGMPSSFERVNWTGDVPFEIKEMRAVSDGFELEFTKPVNASTVSPEAFTINAYTYIYQSDYGSPEVDKLVPEVSIDSISADGRTVRLAVDPLTKGHVHELEVKGLKSAKEGYRLLHDKAYYTLNEIPK